MYIYIHMCVCACCMSIQHRFFAPIKFQGESPDFVRFGKCFLYSFVVFGHLDMVLSIWTFTLWEFNIAMENGHV